MSLKCKIFGHKQNEDLLQHMGLYECLRCSCAEYNEEKPYKEHYGIIPTISYRWWLLKNKLYWLYRDVKWKYFHDPNDLPF